MKKTANITKTLYTIQEIRPNIPNKRPQNVIKSIEKKVDRIKPNQVPELVLGPDFELVHSGRK